MVYGDAYKRSINQMRFPLHKCFAGGTSVPECTFTTEQRILFLKAPLQSPQPELSMGLKSEKSELRRMVPFLMCGHKYKCRVLVCVNNFYKTLYSLLSNMLLHSSKREYNTPPVQILPLRVLGSMINSASQRLNLSFVLPSKEGGMYLFTSL